MKSKSVMVICCVAFLVRSAVDGADAVDPFSDSESNEATQPENPTEVAFQAKLNQLGPRLKGLCVSSNGDGTCSVSVDPDEKPDLSAIKGLPVREVEIMGNMDLLASGGPMDLAPLAGLPLERLWIWKVPLKDISPLKSTRLKELLIMGAGVTDIHPLKDLPLTDLNLWCTEVSDISTLKGMRLKHLNIDASESARVEDLTPLEGMELESLQFHANGVNKGIEAVRGMKSLKEINRLTPEEFWKGYDADAPARAMVAKAGLKFTRLDGCADGKIGLWFHGDDLVDLSPLGGLPVVSLGFRDSKVSDLRPLTGMSLRSLCIESPALTDLSPLRGTPITQLYLNCGNLIDLTPLRETKLDTLALSCSKLADLSALRNLPLEYLNIRGCGVTDLNPLEGLPIEDIHFDLGRITTGLEVLREMKSLKQINYSKAEDFWNEFDGKKPKGGDSNAMDPFAVPGHGQSE